MVRTQSLIGGLNMRKGYAMYYHVEMFEISRVNLQMGLHNEKVQDICGNFMEHRKKRRGRDEPIQHAMVGHSSIPIILTCYLYASSISQVSKGQLLRVILRK